MAYDKLQALGEEKFRRLVNELVRGKPAEVLARVVQMEWGDLSDTSEKTLAQQLVRLRASAAEGMFGPEVAKEIAQGATPQIKRLAGISFSAIERMEELSGIQRQRIMDLVEKERHLHTGPLMEATNAVFNDYKELLVAIQKIRFDLGLDEFKGPLTHARGATVTTTSPDGTQVQRQVFEAVSTIESIFDRRQIPTPT